MRGGENMHLERPDKERLARIVDFLQDELDDFKEKFLTIDYKNYSTNNDIRRNLERCIENIVNASLDAGKIILINEKISIPDTYREYFLSLGVKDILDKNTADILANGVRLRNILAHQYLDIRWQKLEKFIVSDWNAYEIFVDGVKKRYLI